MHFVTIHAAGAADLTPGETYLLDDHTTGQYLMMGWTSDAVRYEPLPLPMPDQAAPESLLLIRSGGLGDLLFLTPALRALRVKWPRCRIGVCSWGHHHQALCHPSLDDIERVPYPLTAARLHDWQIIRPLEMLIERDNEHDAVEIWARALGVHPLADSTPVFHVPGPALAAAWERFPRHGRHRRRLGIQLRASSRARTWPANFLLRDTGATPAHPSHRTLLDLLDESWQVFLFDSPDTAGMIQTGTPERLVILPNETPPLSFLDSAALLATMDVVLAPDSSLCHVAGALGLPTVALYGPFHWSRRTNHFPTVRAIQGHAPCAPCHHHMRMADHFPHTEPCARAGFCSAMANITPARVHREILKLARHAPTLNAEGDSSAVAD